MRRKFKFTPFNRKREPQFRVNEQIRIPRVLVIDEKGEHLGEMDNFEALNIARERELDLIEVAPNVRPPVCKIMDFGKFQYQKSKQKRASQAKQKKVEMKEVRLTIRTEEHDRNFKKDQVEKFLKKGNKVKMEIILKGREKAHQGLAQQILTDFEKGVTTPHKIEEPMKRFPGGFNIIITP